VWVDDADDVGLGGARLVCGAPYVDDVEIAVMAAASFPPRAAIFFAMRDGNFLTCGFVPTGTAAPPAVGIDSTYWAIAGIGSGDPAAAAEGAASATVTAAATRPCRSMTPTVPDPRAPAVYGQPVSAAEMAPEASKAEPWLERHRELPITFGLSALFFWLAYDNGSFTVVSRTSLAIVIWWTIGMGFIVRLWPRARPTSISIVIAGLLTALVAWTAASASWGSNSQATYDEVSRTILYLGVFVLVVLAAPWTRARVWSNAFALALTAVAVLALLSRLFPAMVGSDVQYRFLPFGQTRLSYPVGYWNGLAILVMLALPFLLRVAIAGRAPALRAAAVAAIPSLGAVAYLASSRGGFVTGIFAALAFVSLVRRRLHTLTALAVGGVASAAAIALLHSRSALVNDPGSATATSEGRTAAVLLLVVASGAAVVYAAADAVVRRREFPRRLENLALMAVAVAVALAVIVSHPTERFHTFKSLPVATGATGSDYVGSHLTSSSGNGRWQYWTAAYDEFRAHPLVGGGAGSFAEWWTQHRPINSAALDAHSLYLEVFGELGLVGGLLLLALVAVGLFLAVRRPLQSADRIANAASLGGAFVAYAAAAGFDWMWELTIVTLVGIVALALLSSPTFVRESPPRLPRMLSGGLIALAVLFIAVETLPLVAADRLAASQSAVRSGDGSTALAAARTARRIEPWASAPYLQTALVLEQLGRLQEAGAAIDSAIARDPHNWELWLVKARLEATSGDIAASRTALARIRVLNPFAPIPGPGS
jgi:hypothetical protein